MNLEAHQARGRFRRTAEEEVSEVPLGQVRGRQADGAEKSRGRGKRRSWAHFELIHAMDELDIRSYNMGGG